MIDLANMKDDGYETVRLMDEASGAIIYETQLDLWEAHSRIADLQMKFKGKPDYEFCAAIVDYLTEKGFPPVSHRFAINFNNGVVARVQALKNSPAGAPLPGSPASTESTHSG